jgi:ubiquitin
MAALASMTSSIQIFVKSPCGKTLSLEVENTETVQNLKAKIQDKEDSQSSEQRLVYNGKVLEDGNTLASYAISNDSVIHMTFKTRGG